MAFKRDPNSKTAKLTKFLQDKPEGWEKLPTAARKALASKATGMSNEYLKSTITKSAELKKAFAIATRKRRGGRKLTPRVFVAAQKTVAATSEASHAKQSGSLANQIDALQLPELIALSKRLRQAIDRRIDQARAEIAAYRS